MVLEGLLYSEDHEWVKVDGNKGRVGITDYAQEALGSVVFIELPEIGLEVAAEASVGVLESVKAASDYYAPVSGKVLAVNDSLLESPGLINEDPYGRGWMIEVEIGDQAEVEKLLTAGEYRDLLVKDDR